jgi:putative phosphoribosyl transferase
MQFVNRIQAGNLLADALKAFRGDANLIILALPRGGVPVAYQVAQRLGASLDVFIVRKLGVPYNQEFAMGAIASGGVRVLMSDTIRQLGISQAKVDEISAREEKEIARREATYRGDRPALDLTDKQVILVDDGIATGATMLAAVPVAPLSTVRELEHEADMVVCLYTPEPFWGVGSWYDDFSQTTDEEVRRLLSVQPKKKSAEVSMSADGI